MSLTPNTGQQDDSALSNTTTNTIPNQNLETSSLPQIRTSDIEPHDVVCGRRSLSHTWVGNRKFRKIIAKYREPYKSAPCRATKTNITCTILDKVRESGGRFLKFDMLTEKWYEIDNDAAHDKVSHALRSAKDPNRPRQIRQTSIRTFTLSAEQEEYCKEIAEDQQQIFDFLKGLDYEERTSINDVDIDSMIDQIEQYRSNKKRSIRN